MQDKINVLPVLTWNHLGVNWAEKKFSLPEAPEEKSSGKNFSISLLPSGVEKIESFPKGKNEMESGIGSNFDNYVTKNANASCFFKAIEKTTQTIRLKTSISAPNTAIIGDYGIYAGKGSRITLLLETDGAENGSGFTAELTRIYAEKGALVKLIQVQNLNHFCSSWNGVAIHTEDGARVEVVRAVLGGDKAALGAKALLKGKESSYLLNTIYFGDHTQIFDFNDTSEHFGKNTQCDMYTAGVLAGESSKILRGTIDFKRGSAYSAGHETEEVLMLGKKVRNRTVPLILCGEEQVEGQHAATIGRLDESQIYYLCSRGLTPSQARLLLVEGRFAPVLAQIPDQKLREELSLQIERRLKDNETK